MGKGFRILLKIGATLIAILGLTLTAIYFIYNQPLPKSTDFKGGDALATKMLNAIDLDTYSKTRYLEWTFKDIHTYKWDKNLGRVKVSWDNIVVNLNLNNPNKSKVLENNTAVDETHKKELISQATSYFNNDSFWLVAPFKIFDKGTQRSKVILENGDEALLVTYTSGGTTPGDSYLWHLDENFRPISYQMWTKIIPIGGISATWENWQVMENGLTLPTSHNLGPIGISMQPVKGYN